MSVPVGQSMVLAGSSATGPGLEETNVISGALKINVPDVVTSGAGSSSVIVMVYFVWLPRVAFMGFFRVRTTVLSSFRTELSMGVTVKLVVFWPAGILTAMSVAIAAGMALPVRMSVSL